MVSNIYIGFDRDGTLEMPGHPVPVGLMKQFESLKKWESNCFWPQEKIIHCYATSQQKSI